MMNKFLFLLFFPVIVFSQSQLDVANKLFKKGQYNKAESILSNYLSEHPNDVNALEMLGDVYAYQEKWDAAIDNYKKLVKAHPKVANNQYKYGGAMGMKALSISKLRALSLIDDIKDAFLKAAKLDKNHIEVRWALVQLYIQLPGILGGSTSKALKYSNELQQLSTVDGYLAKGYIYEDDDEPELAETYYKKAIKEGGSLTGFNKLTNLYENGNQPEKAIANIGVAQVNHRRNALYYKIGEVAAKHNIELDKGEQCLKTYLQYHSSDDDVPKAWAHYRLAQIYTHQENKMAALKHIDLAITALPQVKSFKTQKKKILVL
ncbi:tetratricopeptide repeat protein [Changchengzhania lutea]|uniref:tetratricopeptide repeat protein n=1 Tax=Changchengzhania lutea TaxID=2049305 RepID=UPI0029391934|nr:tetratricopeptide repeat protein [Changchengzhania lutea]